MCANEDIENSNPHWGLLCIKLFKNEMVFFSLKLWKSAGKIKTKYYTMQNKEENSLGLNLSSLDLLTEQCFDSNRLQ